MQTLSLLILLLLSGYLWIWDLNQHYFTQDNALHLSVSWNILKTFRADGHPPLYYILLKGVMSTFGVDSPLVLRSVSLVSGFLAVLVAFFLGKKIGKSQTVGFVTAFLLATSPLFIQQSQVVRQYSLLVLFLFLILLFFQKDQFKLSDFLKVGAILFLAACTHYSYIMFLPAVLLVGLRKVNFAGEPSKRLFMRAFWTVLVFCIATFSFLMLRSFGWSPQKNLSSYKGHIENLGKRVNQNIFEVGSTIWELLRNIFGENEVWIILVLIFIGTATLIRDKKKDLLILFFGSLLTGISLSLVQRYPLTGGRHSIYLIPVFFIPIIWAIGWINKKARWTVIAFFLTVLGTQLLEKTNRYNIVNSRNYAARGELGPRFFEMNSISRFIEKLSLEETTMFDGFLAPSVRAEKDLKPKWSVFLGLQRPIKTCFFWPGYVEVTPCHCFKNIGTNDFALLVKKSAEKSLHQLQKKEPCFKFGEKHLTTENYLLISIQAE